MSDSPFDLPVPSREEAQSAAFEVPNEPIQVAGLSLRPFTSTSWERCQRLDIGIALEKFEEIKKMPTARIMKETAFVGWMQSTDIREVARAFAAGDEEVWVSVELWEAEFNARPGADKLWLDLVQWVTETILLAESLLFSLAETDESKKLKAEGGAPPGN